MAKRVLVHGRKLSGLRGGRYLTQEELARRLEMSAANVRRLEQAEVGGMRLKSFRKLAEAMEMTPDQLRARIGAPEPQRDFEPEPKVDLEITAEAKATRDTLLGEAGRRDGGQARRRPGRSDAFEVHRSHGAKETDRPKGDARTGKGVPPVTIPRGEAHVQPASDASRRSRPKMADSRRLSVDARVPQPGGTPAQPKGLDERAIHEVVEIERFHGVSAARPEDRTDLVRELTPVPAGPRRRFSVTVDGDCMDPKYRHGDVVIFSVDAAEREGIVEGRNYFVQFDDGENTFKRLFFDRNDPDGLLLRCWNERYPERRVKRSRVKLVARAVYRLVPDA